MKAHKLTETERERARKQAEEAQKEKEKALKPRMGREEKYNRKLPWI